MNVIGLVGPVAAGKTASARVLVDMGIPCFDADKVAHSLLVPGGGAVDAVMADFGPLVPGLKSEQGGIERRRLSDYLVRHPAQLSRLERVLHPLIEKSLRIFLHECRRRRVLLVALDIPLLLEKNWQHYCDRIILLTAPAFLCKQRVAKRPGFTARHARVLSSRQWPLARKHLYADVTIATGAGRAYSVRALRRHVVRWHQRAHNKTRHGNRRRHRYGVERGMWMKTP